MNTEKIKNKNFKMSSDKSKEDKTLESEESDDDDFCPALPPHLLKHKSSDKPKIIGPALPPGMTNEDLSELASSVQCDSASDDIIGPMPIRTKEEYSGLLNQAERERLSLLHRDQHLNKPVSAAARESWMTELPEEKSKLAIFGLGSRKFATKAGIEKGDTSVWTDSPAEKEKKKLTKPAKRTREESKAVEIDESHITKIVDTYNAKERAVPLIDMHTRKRKKEEPDVKERQPFNREKDMDIHKFDQAQKASIMRKAHQLDDRFSKGSKRYL